MFCDWIRVECRNMLCGMMIVLMILIILFIVVLGMEGNIRFGRLLLDIKYGNLYNL